MILARLRLSLPLALFIVLPAMAAVNPLDLSLEELMNIEITSVAKKSQRLHDAAAAISVITRDDIRRSGATSVPELLRLAPGVQVSRIDASRYAVSIRGFSGRWSSKLLVMQDGRTLYSPLFAGVYWEAQDLLLEDVERIEVIRGPGGTLWGANAVNGIINIITRDSAQTQGSHVEATAGTLEHGVAARHGGKLGEIGHYRAYAKFDRHDDLEIRGNRAPHDAWQQGRAGFRADLLPTTRDRFTLMGDFYDKHADQQAIVSPLPALVPFARTGAQPDTAHLTGANLLLRWERSVSALEEWKLQAYVDQTSLRDINLEQHIDTADLEYQHRLPLTAGHELTWGLGYRRVADALRNRGNTILFTPRKRTTELYSFFLQDEITLRDNLQLTLGSKFEHNDFTGFEYQPSARLMWQATPTDNLWAGVARAVQTPSRAADDARLNYLVLGPTTFAFQGNRELQSEKLLAWEIGYRGRFGEHFQLDATAFLNDYEKLLSVEPLSPGNTVSRFENRLSGKTRGFELAGYWQATPAWRLQGSYSRLLIDLDKHDSADMTSIDAGQWSAPRHMAQLHSRHDLGRGFEFDAALYYNSGIPKVGTPAGRVDAHSRLDLRLGWRARPDLELSLVARNLLDSRHTEYFGQDVVAAEIPRSLLAQLKLRF